MPPRARKTPDQPERKTTRKAPASTPEARENHLISLATDLAERQMNEGTASAQVITHYLKLGSTREQMEQRRMELEMELLEKKVESMASAKRVEELYDEAIKAMRRYSGDAEPGIFDEP